MNDEDGMKVFDREVQKEPHYAHILLEHPALPASLERVREVLLAAGGAIVEERPIGHEWLLLKLRLADIRPVALKLTELSYTIIQGANPVPEQNRAATQPPRGRGAVKAPKLAQSERSSTVHGRRGPSHGIGGRRKAKTQ
jgi:hypothetical protein